MKKYIYEYYIGMRDKDTLEEIDVDKAIEIICDAFLEVKLGFSVVKQLGGYVNEKGTFYTENSIKVTAITTGSEQLLESHIEALLDKFNQESVIIVRKIIDSEYC